MIPADTIDRLGTEGAFAVNARARALEAEGRSMVHLEMGEPDFPTAPHIIEAAYDAMRRGDTHYVPPLGIFELRETIARHLGERGIPASPANVAVAPGAKPLIFLAMLAALGPGDEVILPDPGFPIYPSVTRFTGARPVPLRLHPELDYGFDPDELRAALSNRTRLIMLTTPHNPTGAVLGPDLLEAIAAAALDVDAYVLSDEIYCRLIYRGQHHSIAALPGMADRTIVIDGFSKAYAMTGWRLGYALLPPALVSAVELLIINSWSCTAAFSQRAAIAALQGPQDAVEAMRAEFERRRDYLARALRSIEGLTVNEPAGAFYAFPDVSAFGTSAEVAEGLLTGAGVAVLDGAGFGDAGQGHIRLSYATSMANLEEAVDRMRRWFASR